MNVLAIKLLIYFSLVFLIFFLFFAINLLIDLFQFTIRHVTLPVAMLTRSSSPFRMRKI